MQGRFFAGQHRAQRACGRNSTRRGMLAISLAVAGMSWATQRQAKAQTLTWDASGHATSTATVTDGSGNWDTLSSSNWFTGTGDSAWVNGDSAVFGNANGAAGIVTIDDPSGSVSVGTLTFNPAGSGNYTIAAAAGDSLNLSASNSNPLITVSSGVSATISAPIGGSFNSYTPNSGTASGLIIKGLGTLTLTGSSSFSGSTIIENNGAASTGTSVVLSGASFGTSGSDIFVGFNPTASATDTSSLTMSNGSTLIANQLDVDYNFGEGTTSTTVGDTLFVNGNETIDANTITVDDGRHSGNAKGGDGSITLASGATLTLNGASGAGNSVGLLDIGDYSYETGGGTGTGLTGSANFSAGTVNGTIGSVYVGSGKAGTPGSDAADGSTATFTFGNGSLNIGTLDIGRIGSQAIVGTVTMAANTTGTLTVGSINFGASGNASGGSCIGVLNVSGGTLDMTGSISTNGSTTATINLNGGVLNLENNSINNSGSSVVTLNAAAGTLLNVQSLNGGGSLTTTGTSTQTLLLAGSNTYTGGTVIGGGLVIANGGESIGQSNSGPLVVNAGTLDLDGFSQTFTSLGGSGGTITNNGVSSPLTLTITNGSGTFGGVIQNGASATALSVTGGSLDLSSTSTAQTFTGPTSISGGATLTVANINSTTAVTNYGSLAAAGTVGTILVDQGGTLIPGTVVSGGTGILHASSVTIGSGGATMNFVDDATASNPVAFDQLIDSGVFTLNGGLSVNVSLSGAAESGTFALVTANGGLALNGNSISSNVTVGGGGLSRLSGTVSETASQIDLIVNGNPANLTWTGAADSTTWDVDNTKNWTSNATTNPDVFFQFDNVTFDNTAPTSADTVNITTTVEPGSVTFNNNSTHNYVINGNGISDSGLGTTLTMNGAGTVTLNNSNSYAGATNVNAGNLIIGSSGSVAGSVATIGTAAAATINSGGSLASTSINVNGTLTDNGAVGGSTLSLSSTGSMTVTSGGLLNTANVNVNGSTLTIQSGGNLASTNVAVATNSSLVVQNGASLNNNPNLTNNGTTSFGSDQNIGALNGTAAAAVLSVAGNLTVNDGGTYAGSIQDGGSGSTCTLNTNGSVALILTGSNSFSGGLNVNGGTTLQIDAGGTTGSINPSLSINDSGTLIYDRSDNISVPNVLNNGGAFRQSGGGTLTLTGNNSNFSGPIQAYNGTIVQDPNNPNTLGNGSENLVLGTPGSATAATATGNIVLSASVTATSVNTISATNSSLSATPTPDVLVIPAGVTLTANGAVSVGYSTTASTIYTTMTATGGGTLNANNGVSVGGGNGTLDLTGLNNVSITGTLNLADGGINQAVLNLANTTVNSVAPVNTINVGTINLGIIGTTVPAGTGILNLGGGSNIINTSTINMGTGRGYGTIQFLPGTPSSASVTITGNPTIAMCEFTNNVANPGAGQSLMAFAGYNANVQAGSITMAENNANIGGGANAAITFDTGTFTAQTITMAIDNGGSSVVGPTATLTIGGSTPNNTATGVFTSNNIVLGDFTNDNAASVASAVATATLNVNGGMTIVNGSITNNSSQGTTVSTLNLAGGTLNMTGNSIGNNGGVNSGNGPVSVNFVPVAGQTATLENLGGSGINGVGLPMSGSGTLILAGSNNFSGATSVNSGTVVVSAVSALPTDGTVTIGTTSTNGILQLGHGISSSVNSVTLSSLTVNTGSTLDLTNNPLFINYNGNTDPVSTIAKYLADGFTAHWAGGEISSSSVAGANASQSALIYSVGYADGADGITTLSSGEIEILPTLAGDAKMQGNVVFGDFQLLSQYFGQSGTSWDEGDFTYNGTTNFGDFQLLSQNFGQSASGLTSGELASINGFAAQFGEQMEPNGTGYSLVSVPEPASVGLLAAAGFSLLARRRRRR
jgi:fibronectin-binding autotransporter adhesin